MNIFDLKPGQRFRKSADSRIFKFVKTFDKKVFGKPRTVKHVEAINEANGKSVFFTREWDVELV